MKKLIAAAAAVLAALYFIGKKAEEESQDADNSKWMTLDLTEGHKDV